MERRMGKRYLTDVMVDPVELESTSRGVMSCWST